MNFKGTDLTWHKYLDDNRNNRCYLYKNVDGSLRVVEIPLRKKKEIKEFEDRKIIIDKTDDRAYMIIDGELTIL